MLFCYRPLAFGEWLQKVVLGYYRYHAIPGNVPQLEIFRRRLCRLWRNVLIHRSQRGNVSWERLDPLFNRWIPLPRVLHSYPMERLRCSNSPNYVDGSRLGDTRKRAVFLRFRHSPGRYRKPTAEVCGIGFRCFRRFFLISLVHAISDAQQSTSLRPARMRNTTTK